MILAEHQAGDRVTLTMLRQDKQWEIDVPLQ
jgi:hypothetical protein